jgi:hypothetical protein
MRLFFCGLRNIMEIALMSFIVVIPFIGCSGGGSSGAGPASQSTTTSSPESGGTSSSSAVIIDHTSTDLSKVPSEWIDQAKKNLHIAYGHTSHGRQIVSGMTDLVAFKGDLYAFNSTGLGGVLELRDRPFSGAEDLGNPDFTAWETATRTFLDANPDFNVVMWAWCRQVSTATEADINTYLSLMSGLERDYPNVMFVYMTGRLDGTGLDGNLNIRNEQIRQYCRSNGKVLYDFADIESYDPDGVYYGDKHSTDACNYDYNNDGTTSQTDGDPAMPTNGDRNWAIDWQDSHAEGVEWYNCKSAHSQPLNANRKAYAAWWLWARLAGWDGK